MTRIFLNTHPAYKYSKNKKIVELRNNNWLNVPTDDNPLFTFCRDTWSRAIAVNGSISNYQFEQGRENEFKAKILEEFGETNGNFLIQFYHQDIGGIEKHMMFTSLSEQIILEKKNRVAKKPSIAVDYEVNIFQDKQTKIIYATVLFKEIRIKIPSFYSPLDVALPGHKLVTYELTNKGFQRKYAEYTNPILEDLDLGNEDVIVTEAQKEFAEEYENLEATLLEKEYPDGIKNQIKSLMDIVNAERKKHPESIQEFTHCLTATNALITDFDQQNLNEYTHTIKKFATNRSWGITISGAMLGVLGAVLVAASIFSVITTFGLLTPFAAVGIGLGCASFGASPFIMYRGLKKETPLSKLMSEIHHDIEERAVLVK